MSRVNYMQSSWAEFTKVVHKLHSQAPHWCPVLHYSDKCCFFKSSDNRQGTDKGQMKSVTVTMQVITLCFLTHCYIKTYMFSNIVHVEPAYIKLSGKNYYGQQVLYTSFIPRPHTGAQCFTTLLSTVSLRASQTSSWTDKGLMNGSTSCCCKWQHISVDKIRLIA